jgi:hypothetical protein
MPPLPHLPFDDDTPNLTDDLRAFAWRGRPTQIEPLGVGLDDGRELVLDAFVNEFWTARQRAAHSLHEISYRACFKPQLPRFFIERLTAPGDCVYDPFMGRGTTLLEAALLGRQPQGCDVNPLSKTMVEARLDPPHLDEVERALHAVDFSNAHAVPPELLAFYHPETLAELCALRKHLADRTAEGRLPRAESWIRMVAVNRLTGHSPGFFSVYTMPPNQAVSLKAQLKINERRGQTPPRRDVRQIILKKSRKLLRDCDSSTRARLAASAKPTYVLTASAASTPAIPSESVALVVTSPPFLDVVDYRTDNWLRCWFCGIDADAVRLTTPRSLATWQAFITSVFRELRRVLRRGGHVAFEVGEIRGGALKLEHAVVGAAIDAGLDPLLVLINDQRFTKTANCWGVENNRKGTNTNRVVLLRKP